MTPARQPPNPKDEFIITREEMKWIHEGSQMDVIDVLEDVFKRPHTSAQAPRPPCEECIYQAQAASAAKAERERAQQRIDAEHEVIKAAMNWWMMQRPLDWSEEQHLKHPTINIFGNQERALAEAIALL
jgi:hypothetical protein